jgi:hypothetical protein
MLHINLETIANEVHKIKIAKFFPFSNINVKTLHMSLQIAFTLLLYLSKILCILFSISFVKKAIYLIRFTFPSHPTLEHTKKEF